MKYTVVHSSEWTYPDTARYESAACDIALHTPRNSFATAQVLLSDVPVDAAVSVKTSGGLDSLPLTVYELVPVHVEDNPFLPKGEIINGCPSRWAPFDIYDCAKPLAALTPKNGTAGLYLSFSIGAGAAPGAYAGAAVITVGNETIEIPGVITVHRATVPADDHI